MKKNIFITGASGNLGKATVEKFVSEGHQIICTVSSKGLGFEPAGLVHTVEADLTNELQVGTVVQSTIDQYQHIDAAVLLVGAFAPGNIEETDGATINRMISLNFETAYCCVRPIFKHMKEQHIAGRLVLIGSRPALNPHEGKDAFAYALSKSMLFELAAVLNADGAPNNIVTSIVVPGVIDTPTNRKANPTADFNAWVTPETVANTIYLAATEESLREPIFKVYGKS